MAVVPIGGGGLISGVSMALKACNPKIKIIGVESSDGPAMKKSVEAGHLVTLDKVDCIIDGLRVKRVGENTFNIVQHYVDDGRKRPENETGLAPQPPGDPTVGVVPPGGVIPPNGFPGRRLQ